MPNTVTFLIADLEQDTRMLLSFVVVRKFPSATVLDCGSMASAIESAKAHPLSGIVLHPADREAGAALVSQLREIQPGVPIIYLSTADREKEALALGATRFLPFQEWLRLGVILQKLLEDAATTESPQAVPKPAPARMSLTK
jgi:hypothetical protein